SAVGYIGKLLEYTPGKLIGMAYGEVAYHTGTENRGMIFEIELDSGISTVNTLLDGSNGRHPFNSGLTHVNIISNPVVQCKPVTIFLDANGNALLNPADVYDGTPVEGLDLLLDKNEFTCSDVGD